MIGTLRDNSDDVEVAIDPHLFIRNNIKYHVNEILMLDVLKNAQRNLDEIRNTLNASARCVVCTLPMGECLHTKQWLRSSLPPEFSFSTNQESPDHIESELNDIFSCLQTNDVSELFISSNQQYNALIEDDIDLDSLKWTTIQPIASDRIGNSFMVLSAPCPRGWHTTVNMTLKSSFDSRSGQIIIIFGGYRLTNDKAPQPFATEYTNMVLNNEFEFLNDVCIFDVDVQSWHRFIIPEHSLKKIIWPQARYGHCATVIGTNKMIIYGGRGINGHVLNDIWLLEVCSITAPNGITWTCLFSGQETGDYNDLQKIPSPRYFSACCAVPNTSISLTQNSQYVTHVPKPISTMNAITFQVISQGGGLNQGSTTTSLPPGVIETTNISSTSTENTSETVTLLCDILLFGGTNGDDIFNDTWVFHIEGYKGLLRASTPCWSRVYPYGENPTARYGHAMLKLSNESVVLVGGCAISPRAEMEQGIGVHTNDRRALHELALQLQQSYRDQGMEAKQGGKCLKTMVDASAYSGLNSGGFGSSSAFGIRSATTVGGSTSTVIKPKDVLKKACNVTGRIATAESTSDDLEMRLGKAWRGAQAASLLDMSNSKNKHPYESLDVYILSVALDFSWFTPTNPSITGHIPSARIFFGSYIIGPYLMVLGGAVPTCLNHSPVDNGPNPGKASDENLDPPLLKVYALNTVTMVWSAVTGYDGISLCMSGILDAAKMDEKISETRCEEEKWRGMAMGVSQGLTLEYMQAVTLRDISRWRRQEVEKDISSIQKAPITRWGFTIGYACGMRAFLFGGWEPTTRIGDGSTSNVILGTKKVLVNKARNRLDLGQAASKSLDILVMDLEHDLERRRRLEEEFHARLERERQLTEKRARQLQILTMYDVRKAKEAELLAESAERAMMTIEDIRSSLPPLSRPNPVRLKHCNEHTMWLEWDKVAVNTRRQSLPAGQPTYMLFMRGGFETISLGDNVWVLPVGIELKEPDSCFLYDDFDNEPKKFYAGVIVKVWEEQFGVFDIQYSDGYREKEVHYTRIHLRYPPSVPTYDSMSHPTTVQTMAVLKDDSPFIIHITTYNDMITTNIKNKSKRGRIHNRIDEKDNDNDEEENGKKKKKLINMIPYPILRSFTDWNAASLVRNSRWKLIYMGSDTSYACQSVIPYDILEKDPETIVSAVFRIQTIGTEFPTVEYSLPSLAVSFWTYNPLNIRYKKKKIENKKKTKMTEISKFDTITTTLPETQITIQLDRAYETVVSQGTGIDLI